MHAANVIVYLLIGSLIGGEQFRVSREYKREHHRHPLSVPDSKSSLRPGRFLVLAYVRIMYLAYYRCKDKTLVQNTDMICELFILKTTQPFKIFRVEDVQPAELAHHRLHTLERLWCAHYHGTHCCKAIWVRSDISSLL
jgi:hypothetical protein